MKSSRGIVVLWLIVGGCTAQAVFAGETPIQRSQLPAAVAAALESRYPGAEFLGLTREDVKGHAVFEAEMKIAGHRVDAAYDSNGALREEEREIAVAELPAPLRRTLARSAQATWSIDRAERIQSGTSDQVSRYELLVSHRGRRLEIQCAPDGRRLSAAPAAGKD